MAKQDIPMTETTSQPTARKPVSLALQGGGSWGAYTWGVLDALLSGRSVTIAQMSGTSAGALNGAIVASALAAGGAAHARRKLRSFWMTVASPDVYCGSTFCPTTSRWREELGAWLMSNPLASPYSTNPLGNDLLR